MSNMFFNVFHNLCQQQSGLAFGFSVWTSLASKTCRKLSRKKNLAKIAVDACGLIAGGKSFSRSEVGASLGAWRNIELNARERERDIYKKEQATKVHSLQEHNAHVGNVGHQGYQCWTNVIYSQLIGWFCAVLWINAIWDVMFVCHVLLWSNWRSSNPRTRTRPPPESESPLAVVGLLPDSEGFEHPERPEQGQAYQSIPHASNHWPFFNHRWS